MRLLLILLLRPWLWSLAFNMNTAWKKRWPLHNLRNSLLIIDWHRQCVLSYTTFTEQEQSEVVMNAGITVWLDVCFAIVIGPGQLIQLVPDIIRSFNDKYKKRFYNLLERIYSLKKNTTYGSTSNFIMIMRIWTESAGPCIEPNLADSLLKLIILVYWQKTQKRIKTGFFFCFVFYFLLKLSRDIAMLQHLC